ncbi:MAG: hypothetical protein CMI01_01075 [Oceanospirillaceae bacterium]|nr:hypothetical protein [Oceanospirillaceae bacterium]
MSLGTLMPENRSQENGFSLIELMITLAIAVILLTVGVPSYSNFVQDARLDAAQDSLLSAMQFAQSEALKRNEQIKVQPKTCGAGGCDWSSGLNVLHLLPDPDVVLRETEALENVTLACTSGCDSLTFYGDGALTAAAAGAQFSACTPQGNGRGFQVYMTGKVKKVADTDDGDAVTGC